ncbi:MAG: ATP synthase subunit I [Rubrivivax sp.]|nr:ATP synthase subunit I [Rubrivivax sp.]
MTSVERKLSSASRQNSQTRDEGEDSLPPFKALTRQEAQTLIAGQPTVSPWRVIVVQVMVGLAAAAVMGLLWGEMSVAMSALYGAAVVVVPGVLMARGMTSRFSSMNAGTSAVSFMLWEMLKIAVSVVMLMLAPKLVQNLSWPALLAALVMCIKVYWLALLWRGR